MTRHSRRQLGEGLAPGLNDTKDWTSASLNAPFSSETAEAQRMGSLRSLSILRREDNRSSGSMVCGLALHDPLHTERGHPAW